MRLFLGDSKASIMHLGIGDERAGDGEASAHPARVGGARAAAKLLEVNVFEEGGDAAAVKREEA